MRTKRTAFLATLILGLLPVQLSRPVVATETHAPGTAYLFVEIEATVYRKGVEISSENPEERRWYFSNVMVQPEDVATYSLIKQKFIPYFSHNVMDPFEAKGFALDYGEQDVRLNGEVSQANYATKAEADKARDKEIDYRKNQSGNIYSFEIDFANPKGELTSKPKLIYRDKGQPNYGNPK